jgi:hypothetical protein
MPHATAALGRKERELRKKRRLLQTEAVLQVAPQLATPTKSQPAALAVRACPKSPPAKPTRVRSPGVLAGDTPSRTEMLRQNAADRMSGVEADAAKWAVIVTVPKEANGLSAAAEFKQEEAASGWSGEGPSLETRT